LNLEILDKIGDCKNKKLKFTTVSMSPAHDDPSNHRRRRTYFIKTYKQAAAIFVGSVKTGPDISLSLFPEASSEYLLWTRGLRRVNISKYTISIYVTSIETQHNKQDQIKWSGTTSTGIKKAKLMPGYYGEDVKEITS
jgi:hypothetical protein